MTKKNVKTDAKFRSVGIYFLGSFLLSILQISQIEIMAKTFSKYVETAVKRGQDWGGKGQVAAQVRIFSQHRHCIIRTGNTR